MEKIGQVLLDDTLYPGKDLYTDGAIEDEMLEIARNYREEEWNQVIAERASWPILYHFSHIRENILSWLPFTGEENVLEIGSGCGAVTGALCKKAKQVTCIELSRKRSHINAWRHRNCDNLKILMGNFQDVEKTLTEKYDYITLIGVFEYGEAYIQSDTPYVDFLKIISKHLKPDGKIVLAIENRLGLKYWAGCTEDHFGTLFEGLEGYPTTKGVKTFSRKEFMQILSDAGDLQAEWYYPFPDYKFPMTIYSDRRLPNKGELNRVETNYDRLRLQLFQESPVYDSLLDNDLFPQFSNSFLMLISKEEFHPETDYVKFSNERDPRFALRTEICQEKGQKYVQKLPADARAAEHIRNIGNTARELTALYGREGLELNACTPVKDGVTLEYLNGVTLEEYLDSLLMEDKLDEVEVKDVDWKDIIRDYYGTLEKELEVADKEIEKVEFKEEPTGELCEKCGKPMVIKHGRFGEFAACTGYPECKNTKPIVKSINVKCPKCGKDIVARRSKTGRVFYGCSGYPDCQQSYWNKPIDRKCPKCGSLLVEKNTKKIKYACSNSECDYKEEQ